MISRSLDQGFLHRLLDSAIQRYRYHRWRVNPRKYVTELRSIPVKQPMFILGIQGGGLTLLSRYIRRHPSVVSVTGGSDYWTGSDEMQNVMADVLPESLRLRKHPVLRRFNLQESWTYATDRLLPHFRKTADQATEELREELLRIIREVLLLYGRGASGLRFLDKSQSYTVKVSFLSALLEDHGPRFLLVTRNPYAVCKRAVDQVLIGTGLSYEDRVRAATEHWGNSMRVALKDGEETEDFAVIRFEDFLAAPVGTVEQIAESLNIDLREDLLPAANDRVPLGTPADGKWYPLRPQVNEKYLNHLSKDLVEAVDERCGDLAERFGYTSEGS